MIVTDYFTSTYRVFVSSAVEQPVLPWKQIENMRKLSQILVTSVIMLKIQIKVQYGSVQLL